MQVEIVMFSGKTLLITGGTGTFGNAVLKRFLETEIAEIRVFSRDGLLVLSIKGVTGF